MVIPLIDVPSFDFALLTALYSRANPSERSQSRQRAPHRAGLIVGVGLLAEASQLDWTRYPPGAPGVE